MDMFDKPLDNLDVTLSEGGHEDRHLPVVLTVHVGSITEQQLTNLKMSTCKHYQTGLPVPTCHRYAQSPQK